MNLAIFSYNFPHRKTQDFLWELLTRKLRPTIVLAQNPGELNIPEPTVRVKPRYSYLVHPREICETFGIPYQIVDHNSQECMDLLNQEDIDIGVISGSRILRGPILRSVRKGIINFHPGLIPEVRGLDALQWAIYEGHPLGVTAHVIDERVDAGYVIQREIIEEYCDDTLIDLSLRLYETEIKMITSAVRALDSRTPEDFPHIGKSILHRKMPPQLESNIPQLLHERFSRLYRTGSGTSSTQT
jgi:phosphoribosylglycinamide formyltransferase 1